MTTRTSRQTVTFEKPVSLAGSDGGLPAGQAMPAEPKLRNCLRCQTSFESEWSGERICRKCKSTAAWRTGMPAPSYPTNRRK